MANIVSQNTSPTLNLKNIEDLGSTLVDRNFGRPEDYIEIHIYDLNNNLLDTVEDFKGYKSEQNTKGLIQDLNLDPLGILNELGYTTGTYNLKVNIQKRKILNFKYAPFKIKEISSTRTEIKLTTTLSDNNFNLFNNSRNFIQAVQNSTYFRDFILNFGKDRNVTAVNITIDTSNPNDNVLQIKLLEPLLENLKIGDKLSIVENIVDPIILTYDLGLLPPIDTTVPIKGPNFKIDTRLNSSVPTAFRSYDDILSTSTTSSYQKLISKLDGYNVPEIDYGYVRPTDTASLDFETITPTHFENFVHFGSATELLKNFEYKLKLIEVYNKQINELNSISSTSLNAVVLESSSSISTKKENLIQGFSGYEQYLYFESGAYSWPKTGSHPQEEPYIQSHTTSSEASAWLGNINNSITEGSGQLSSASIFDKQNPNRLMKLVPTFIGDREENQPFELFCDMVGEHFDPVWTHVKEITQTTDNSHKLGVSKNLVYYMLQNLGIEAHDQFENEDLINYVFGQPITSNDSSTVITGSNETFAKQDITKEIWKRLYHNAPYLLKTKGTERGLRALINCYGISDTILDIKEFGSSNPNRDDFKLYTYNKFTQVLSGDTAAKNQFKGMFIETAWTSSNTDAIILKPSASAKTVEFRIKPTRSGSDAYHLFSLTNHTTQSLSGSDLHLVLHPYTGSHDFFTTDDKTQYGKLDLLHFTSSILTSSGHQLISPIELADTINVTATGTGATINNKSKVTFTSDASIDFVSPIVPASTMTAGKKYRASATISEYSDTLGTDSIGFGNSGGVGNTVGEGRLIGDGTISHTFVSDGANIKIFAGDGAAGVMDNISVKEILHDSEYFPVFNGNFWNISLGTDGISGSNSTIHLGAYQANHLREVLHYTSSVLIDEITNAESFGSHHYSDTGSLILNGTFAGFDASAQTVPNWTLQDDGDGFQASTSCVFRLDQGQGQTGVDVTITLISTDGTSKRYEGIASNVGILNGALLGNGNTAFHSDGTIEENTLAFKSAVEGAITGHAGRINIVISTTTNSSDTITFTQNVGGTAGNTSITVGDDWNNLSSAPNNFSGGTNDHATFSSVSDGIKVEITSTPTNTFEVRVKQNISNKLKLGHKYRLSFEAKTTDNNLNAFISTTNGQNNQLNPTNAINNGPSITDSDYTYYQTTFETTYINDTNNTVDTNQSNDDGDLFIHFYLTSAATNDTAEIKKVRIEELSAPSSAYFGGIKDYTTAGIITSSFYTNNNLLQNIGNQLVDCSNSPIIGTGTHTSTVNSITFGSGGGGFVSVTDIASIEQGKTYRVLATVSSFNGQVVGFGDLFGNYLGLPDLDISPGSKVNQTLITANGGLPFTLDFIFTATATGQMTFNAQNGTEAVVENISIKEQVRGTDTFTLGYSGFLSEVRYYFGELLNHSTLQRHALEPLMYGGNSISSSYDHLIVRYPLSFELDLSHGTTSQVGGTIINPPNTNANNGTTIVGGAIMNTGLTPPFTVAGVPLLQSHHPNTDTDYLDGFTYFNNDDVESLVEEHHLPTPNTIGKSPVNNKVRIDKGTTDDDILSPDILSRLPSSERQVPDFSNIGVFLSPQNELNEDIIYTLGTFSLDEFLGDPREETSEIYEDFKPLVDQYFKKLKKGKDRYNIFDFTRWVSFLDHTLFDLIKKFTPQKSIDKTGVLIEPHFLERPKFRRYHPIVSNTTYEGDLQEITQSFHKNNNISLLDGTLGSAVISYTAFSSSNVHTNYNTFIDVAKALSGSSVWEQSGLNELRPYVLTPRGNFMNSKVSKIKFKLHTSGGLETGPGTLTSTEFDDGLIDLAGWNNPRYNGSKLTGVKINEYNEGDVTYGLNPVVEQKSAAIYFGKSLIGADGEDDDLVTIKNHSYLNIEKIMLINKYTDEITTIDLKNEDYNGINGYIANDLKDGSGFNIELLDNKITHQLKDSYKAKFNQGYLKKIIEHKGINGNGITTGEGIQAGYIDVIESAPATFANSSNTQNVFCYGNHDNTMNSDTLTLKSNPLTRQIWPTEITFGLTDLTVGSSTLVNSSMAHLGTFINSMLIPIASESQYRLFGTLNLGQKQNQGNYTLSSDSGIKSISTFEIDLEKYSDASSTLNGTQVYANIYIDGVDRATHIPNYLLLPIMQGPHDLMTSGITTGDGNDTGAGINSITGVELQHYWSGATTQGSAIYQLSYLEETNVIIADIDKPSELANDVGDKGFVIIPNNIDKDIRDNLGFYLDKAGLSEGPESEKLPLRKN